MGDRSGIVWTDAAWGPVTGCTRVSEGCEHCYIERTPPFRIAHRRFDSVGPGSSTGVLLHPERLDQPLRWRRPRRIFVNSMADLFHPAVSDDYIARVWAVMGLAWQHTFQILTKRPARMRSLLTDPSFHRAVLNLAMGNTFVGSAVEEGRGYWVTDPSGVTVLSNVWLGVSVETQHWADVRVPVLLDTPAAVRFLSCEPLLAEVDLVGALCPTCAADLQAPMCAACHARSWTRRLDWVIVGGESGPGARPMSPRWARLLRDQCNVAGIPFTFKQWGEWTDVEHGIDAAGDDDPLFRRCVGNNRVNGHRMCTVEGQMMVRLGRHKTGRVLDGRTWEQYPDRAA